MIKEEEEHEEEEDDLFLRNKKVNPLPPSRPFPLFYPILFLLFLTSLIIFFLFPTSLEETVDLDSISVLPSTFAPTSKSAVVAPLINNNNNNTAATCIPQSCFVEKHFISSPMQQVAKGQNFVALASFPGSGNTWTRAVIEEGTRIWSGSMYNDDELFRAGYLGERMFAYQSPFNKVATIKTHYPYFTSFRFNPRTTHAILVCRNPFNALLSEFNRKSMRYSGEDEHVSKVSKEVLLEQFPKFFHNAGGAWRKYMSFWTEPQFWERKPWFPAGGGVSSLLLTKSTFFPGQNVTVLVLFYEDFVADFETTSRIMFTFLETESLGKSMPTANDAVVCALRGKKSQEKEKRIHNEEEDYNPYSDPENGVNARLYLESFCNKSVPFWFEDKWGKCLDAGKRKPHRPIVSSSPLPDALC